MAGIIEELTMVQKSRSEINNALKLLVVADGPDWHHSVGRYQRQRKHDVLRMHILMGAVSDLDFIVNGRKFGLVLESTQPLLRQSSIPTRVDGGRIRVGPYGCSVGELS